ncbi:hypothetical protein U9M48_010982 [Paspalum notatum var. saurae]|uniref:Uncharacterized protein n=1 Tax=Paspalum notatum var. saurae TaxID=547442 RepID=A0AAQ3SUC3_PASNO
MLKVCNRTIRVCLIWGRTDAPVTVTRTNKGGRCASATSGIRHPGMASLRKSEHVLGSFVIAGRAQAEAGSARAASASAAVPLRSSDTLAAMLSFAAGETPFSPMMDSSTASQRGLFSIATPPDSGTDESLENATWVVGRSEQHQHLACHHPI